MQYFHHIIVVKTRKTINPIKDFSANLNFPSTGKDSKTFKSNIGFTSKRINILSQIYSNKLVNLPKTKSNLASKKHIKNGIVKTKSID